MYQIAFKLKILFRHSLKLRSNLYTYMSWRRGYSGVVSSQRDRSLLVMSLNPAMV
jgi:hypothetical protein